MDSDGRVALNIVYMGGPWVHPPQLSAPQTSLDPQAQPQGNIETEIYTVYSLLVKLQLTVLTNHWLQIPFVLVTAIGASNCAEVTIMSTASRVISQTWYVQCRYRCHGNNQCNQYTSFIGLTCNCKVMVQWDAQRTMVHRMEYRLGG